MALAVTVLKATEQPCIITVVIVPTVIKLSTMTATLEADHKLSLSEDVLAQGHFKDGMEFRVILKPSGAMILRPNQPRQKSLVEHLRGLQGLELAVNRPTLPSLASQLKSGSA